MAEAADTQDRDHSPSSFAARIQNDENGVPLATMRRPRNAPRAAPACRRTTATKSRRYLAFSFSVSIRSLAAGPEEAGF